MRTPTLLALLGVVAVASIAIGAVVGGIPGTSPPWETTTTEDPRITETGLHDFTATEPACSNPLTGNKSVSTRSVPGGRRLSLEDNVTVAKRGTNLTAHVEKIGPRRYHLALKRRPAGESADCTLQVRYNATMNVSTPDSYTIVVTVDGELQTVLWSTPHVSGRDTTEPDPGDDNGSNSAGEGDEDEDETGSG